MIRSIRNEKDRESWREACLNSPSGSFWADPDWTKILSDSFPGYKDATRILRIENAEIVIPMISVSRSYWLWHSLESMPLGQYGGLLSEKQLSDDAIFKTLRILQRQRITSTTINLFGDYREFEVPKGVAVYKDYTHVLNLPDSADKLWDDCYNPKCRNKIRQGLDAGVQVQSIPPGKGMPILVAIEKSWRNATQLAPHYTTTFFQRIARLPENRIRIFVALIENEPIAATLVFYYRQNAYSFITVDDGQNRALRPVNILVHHALEDAIVHGKATFDFGQSLGKKSLEEFKESFGATKKTIVNLKVFGDLYRRIKRK